MLDASRDRGSAVGRDRLRPDPARLGLAALVLIVVFSLIDPIASLPLEVSRNYNEGWNAYYALRAVDERPLYPADEPLLINNYPPLSFYAVGALGTLTGDMIVAGRLISLIALGLTAVAIGVAARAAGAGRHAAVLAGLVVTGGLCALAPDYIAMNDPQLLGHAVATCGLAALLRHPAAWRNLVLAAGLMAAAGLIKHNLIALPLAVTLWLALDHRAALGRWLLAAAGFAAAAAIGLLVAHGPGAVESLVTTRSYALTRTLDVTRDVLVTLQIPLVAWLTLVLVERRTPAARLVLVYGGTALAVGIGFAGGAGINVNVFFDLLIACALAAGLLFARLEHWLARERAVAATRGVLVLALTVGIGTSLPLDPLKSVVPSFAGRSGDLIGASADDIASLRAVEGPALCGTPALCYWAGKRFVVDPFNVEQAILTGRLDADVLARRLAAREFAVVQWPAGEVFMSDELDATLDRHYRRVRRSPNGDFFRPRATAAPG